MKTEFSFKYDGELKKFKCEGEYAIDRGLKVRVQKIDYPEFDASYQMIWFCNESDENSKIISDIYDCDTLMPFKEMPLRPGFEPESGNICVTTMKGMVPGYLYWDDNMTSAEEYSLHDEYLSKRKSRVICNSYGRSSEGMMPFFNLHQGNRGAMIAIGWTGSWRAEFAAGDEGVSVKTGLKNTHFYLKPGENIRTSSVLIMNYDENDNYSNKFRKLIKKYFSHKTKYPHKRDGLFAMEMWGGLPSAEMIKRVNELQEHNVGFEDLWIDAGWYGDCKKCDEAFSGDWGKFTGDWRVNKRVHPNEFADLKEVLNKNGQSIMLWIEPERVTPHTVQTVEAYKNNPDWFLTDESLGENLIVNYGNRNAFEYAYETVSKYIEKLNLSCYRQDFNIELENVFAASDEENRQGITEIKHIMGMYELWDRLLERFPNLIIDNCSSGGRRIDIETLKRSIPFFRSDYQCNFNSCPEVLQTHNSNISLYLPYNGCTTKIKADTYAVRSAYSSSFGSAYYNAIFQSMTEEDFEWAEQISNEYLKIRKYFSKDFYNYGTSKFDMTSWVIWQYDDPESRSGIIMAFRRPESPFETAVIKPANFGADSSVEIQDNNAYIENDGGELKITIPKKRSSTIIIYKY